METQELKLEIIRLILFLEEKDILQNLYQILKPLEDTEESAKTPSEVYFSESMRKNDFLTWIKDCESSEMMTKQEFKKEYTEWQMTMKEKL
ncbi:MAG: hypothetical protein H7A25_04710 [Leptospiraceae bacterium]|nr:hypothetical protein [Leptospiraceae bacterium]MCP5499178.1 hypothetical protein [Leptospiraceae bacterium]